MVLIWIQMVKESREMYPYQQQKVEFLLFTIYNVDMLVKLLKA